MADDIHQALESSRRDLEQHIDNALKDLFDYKIKDKLNDIENTLREIQRELESMRREFNQK